MTTTQTIVCIFVLVLSLLLSLLPLSYHCYGKLQKYPLVQQCNLLIEIEILSFVIIIIIFITFIITTSVIYK